MGKRKKGLEFRLQNRTMVRIYMLDDKYQVCKLQQNRYRLLTALRGTLNDKKSFLVDAKERQDEGIKAGRYRIGQITRRVEGGIFFRFPSLYRDKVGGRY